MCIGLFEIAMKHFHRWCGPIVISAFWIDRTIALAGNDRNEKSFLHFLCISLPHAIQSIECVILCHIVSYCVAYKVSADLLLCFFFLHRFTSNNVMQSVNELLIVHVKAKDVDRFALTVMWILASVILDSNESNIWRFFRLNCIHSCFINARHTTAEYPFFKIRLNAFGWHAHLFVQHIERLIDRIHNLIRLQHIIPLVHAIAIFNTWTNFLPISLSQSTVLLFMHTKLE